MTVAPSLPSGTDGANEFLPELGPLQEPSMDHIFGISTESIR